MNRFTTPMLTSLGIVECSASMFVTDEVMRSSASPQINSHVDDHIRRAIADQISKLVALEYMRDLRRFGVESHGSICVIQNMETFANRLSSMVNDAYELGLKDGARAKITDSNTVEGTVQ